MKETPRSVRRFRCVTQIEAVAVQCTSGVDCGHVGGRQIEARGILSDVGPDRDQAVGVESGFCAGLDTNRRLHTGSVAWLDFGIPNEQRLRIGVSGIELDTPGAAGDIGKLPVQELPESPPDLVSAGPLNRTDTRNGEWTPRHQVFPNGLTR